MALGNPQSFSDLVVESIEAFLGQRNIFVWTVIYKCVFFIKKIRSSYM